MEVTEQGLSSPIKKTLYMLQAIKCT